MDITLSTQEEMRYGRHLVLPEVGPEGQMKLKQARVLVVGAGGLGCPVLQYLCAAGVGCLGIVDADVVELSNLQRQVLYGSSSLGKNKALAAKERLGDLNPAVTVEAHPVYLDAANAASLIGAYDVIVDASDSFSTRYLVNDHCVAAGKPMVFGAVYRFEGQVAVFNYMGGPTYRCAFPQDTIGGTAQNCEEAGVIGILPGIIGLLQCNEVIKLILGLGEVLSGKMLVYNILSNESILLKVQRNPKNAEEVMKEKDESPDNCQCGCSADATTSVRQVTAVDLNAWITAVPDEIHLVDVREPGEGPDAPFAVFHHHPLSLVELRQEQIPRNMPVVLFCRSGKRSAAAAEKLIARFGFRNLYSLEGGLIQWNATFSVIAKEV